MGYHAFVTINPSKSLISNIDGPVMYIGNIQPNRCDSLVDISKELCKIDKSIPLYIYSGDMTSRVKKKLNKYPNIVIKDPVKKNDVVSIMRTARLLIHIESFKKKDKVLIENAFSTKIPDSLASGVPFMVYAPRWAGFTEYFNINNDQYIYIDNKDKLSSSLSKLLSDNEYRECLVNYAIKLANDNHNQKINSKLIYDALHNLSL